MQFKRNQFSIKDCCFFCGGSNHKRALCPARSRVCFDCGKQGHFAKLCRSPKKKQSSRSTAAISQKQDSDQDSTDDNLEIATFTSSKSLDNDKVNVPVMINGVLAHGLIDIPVQKIIMLIQAFIVGQI